MSIVSRGHVAMWYFGCLIFRSSALELPLKIYRLAFARENIFVAIGDGAQRCVAALSEWSSIRGGPFALDGIGLTKGRVVRLDIPLAILHKAQVGVAGLSSHLLAMSMADLGNYWQLYRNGLLGIASLLLFWVWVSLKFLRRWIIFGIPRVFKSGRNKGA